MDLNNEQRLRKLRGRRRVLEEVIIMRASALRIL
jgi:hypothetical protein